MKFPRGYRTYLVIAAIIAVVGVVLIVLLYRHVLGNLDGALKVT